MAPGLKEQTGRPERLAAAAPAPQPALPTSNTGHVANLYENEEENGNTVSNLSNRGTFEQSAIRPFALRPTASYATEMFIQEKKAERRQTQLELNKAFGRNLAFTTEEIEQIIAKLSPCPKGDLATRVFRQHTDMGLCWSDSFFMILFESQETKAFSLQLVRDFLTLLQEKKYAGLKYNSKKVNQIATYLKAKYNSKLEIAIWEHITLAVQRYALLGFLFMKEEQKEKALVKSRLANRRQSIGFANFDQIHSDLKLGSMGCWEEGASLVGINRFMTMMERFINEQIGTNLEVENATLPLKPEKTIGYYFTIQTTEEKSNMFVILGGAHILSLFLCDGVWFLFDNETGVVPLSTDDSVKISSKGIVSVQLVRNSKRYRYPLSLGDGTIVNVEMPHLHPLNNASAENVNEVSHKLTLQVGSYRLVKKSSGSSAAGAGNGSTAGGRRKTRRGRKGRSLTRKQK